MEFEVLSPAGAHATRGYSHAVRMGSLLFVAGQVAKDPSGQIVGKGDVAAQAEQVYGNLEAVLEAAGSGLDLVGKITVYTTSLEHRPLLAAARDRAFQSVGHFPASTFVVVASLAEPDYLVEVEAVAMIR